LGVRALFTPTHTIPIRSKGMGRHIKSGLIEKLNVSIS